MTTRVVFVVRTNGELHTSGFVQSVCTFMLRHMKITNLVLPLWKVASPFPVFNVKQINIHEVFYNIVWGRRGWQQMKKMFSFQCKILLFVWKR